MRSLPAALLELRQVIYAELARVQSFAGPYRTVITTGPSFAVRSQGALRLALDRLPMVYHNLIMNILLKLNLTNLGNMNLEKA